MAVYGILPTTNLKAEDIRDTLNANGGSVSNDTKTFFTTSAKINPFSKRKPVVLSVNFCQDFDSTKANYDATWWQASDKMCGLVPKVVTSRAAIVSAQDGGMNGWSYRLPSGGSSQPFRLGDFAGYNAGANPPLYDFVISPTTPSKNESVAGSCLQNLQSTSELTFAETGLSGLFFGMYLVHSSGEYTRFVTASVPLSENGTTATVTNDTLNTGTWTAYPCLSEVKYTSSSASEQSGKYYTLPMCQPTTFQVIAQKAYINCEAEWVTSNGIKTEIKVTRLTLSASTAVTYRNNYIQVRFANSSFSDPMKVGEVQKQLEDVSNATDFIFDNSNLTFTALDGIDTTADYKIIVSLGGGDLVTEIPIMEDTSTPIG